MYRLTLFICFLAVSTAFVDRNVQDYERRRLIEERNQEEARRQAQQGASFRRYYRSVSHSDFEPNVDLEDIVLEPYTLTRQRRSQLPNNSGVYVEKSGDDTVGTIKIGHKTDKYDVGATWQKVLHGPNRAKPNFSVGGTYRW